MEKSESIKELATALAKAQAEIENAHKGSVNPHFRSKYADLAEVLNTVRPVYAKHGLAVSQWPSFEGGTVTVETVITHASGEWMSGRLSAPVNKLDAQGVGSATTYCRRYALAAAAGIAQEDDDAESAVGRKPLKAVEKPEEDYQSYEDAHLMTLREASMSGMASLQDAFKKLPASDHKKALWGKHGERLKEGAELAEKKAA